MTDKPSTKRVAPRKFSPEFKRQVVEQSLTTHETVVAVANAHGISSSMIWRWRSEYKANNPSAHAVSFLPVGIKVPSPIRPSAEQQVDAQQINRLELHLGSARLVIHGRPDRQTLSHVIEALR